tara:strand:- start:124 stop:420 length:297 start_codon:yes stop_codon:yes gene_type:complete
MPASTAAFFDEWGKIGAQLTAKSRKQISEDNFALPGRRYPIHDASHARNALARVSQHGTPDEKAKVRSAVAGRYPDMGKKATFSVDAFYDEFRKLLAR